MSIKLMTAAWALDLSPTNKLVLLALSDWANDDGHCWPSLSKLQDKSCLSERAIRNALRALEAGGHISRKEVPGRGVNYMLHPGTTDGMQGYTPPEFHYVYRIEDPATGEFYIGARSSGSQPVDDPYMGSGNWPKAALAEGRALRKAILEVCESREAVGHAERRHVEQFFGEPLCMNRKLPSAGNLAKTGFRGDASALLPRHLMPPASNAPGTSCPPPRQQVPPTPARRAPNTLKTHQNTSVSTSTAGFDAFWQAYPRREGKQHAAKAWAKAVKAKPAEFIIKAATRYAAAKAGTDRQFIKQPATWLNAGCWEDELPDAAPRTRGQSFFGDNDT